MILQVAIPCALVVKGLSRLPVTEEIAGSNPVERAKMYHLGIELIQKVVP